MDIGTKLTVLYSNKDMDSVDSNSSVGWGH